MILPITLTVAGAAALLLIWLAARVSRGRRQFRIGLGDGGNEALLRRIRAHGNYVENMPIVIILIGLLELAGGDRRILWAAGIAFILARIAHAFGMDRPQPDPLRLRMIGIIVTMLILLGLSLYAIWIATMEGPRGPTITYAASQGL